MAFSVVRFGLIYAKLGPWALPAGMAVAWAGWPALSNFWRNKLTLGVYPDPDAGKLE